METTEAYATAVGGVLIILIFMNFRLYIVRGWRCIARVSYNLTYPQLLRRHRFAGPWSRAGIILHVFYCVVNAVCVGFRSPPISSAGLRAANLSLINLIPLLASPHLSFPADLLGVPLRTYRQLHRSAGLMSLVLLSFHALTVVATKTPFPLHTPENYFGLIVRP